jgi:hypothetical protein
LVNHKKIGCKANMQGGQREKKENRREVYDRNEDLQTLKTKRMEDKQKGNKQKEKGRQTEEKTYRR